MRGRSPSGATTAIIAAVVIIALYFGREVLLPLALAILLSFVLAPLVIQLRRFHVGRVPAVLITVLGAVVIFISIAGVIGSQLTQLATHLPQYQSTIRDKIQSVQGAAAGSGLVRRATNVIRDLRADLLEAAENTAGGTPSPAASPGDGPKPVLVEVQEAPLAPFQLIKSIVGPLLQPLGTAGIVIVFLFFILLQREDLRDRFIRLVGASDLQRTTRALDDGIQRLSRYFLMQSAVNACFGVLIGTGLYLIGVPNPLLWGILGGLLRFAPYIGAPMAALFPTLLALAVSPGWSMVVWTLVLFVAIDIVISQGIEPFLYGHSTGLSAVAIVVSAAFWTWLWGPVGLLLSTPLTVCLVVLGRHVEHLQFLDILLGDQPALSVEESFYQRVLAGDPDEAAHQAEQFLKDRPLAEYYDEVAVRGLALAQLDVNRGVLDHPQRLQIKETVEGVIDNLADHDLLPTSSKAAKHAADTSWCALAPEELGPEWQGTPVLCVAGRGSLDEAAAGMLAQLLRKGGLGVRLVPSRAVSATHIAQFEAGAVQAVCLCYLEPESLSGARYLARRLRRIMPNAKILIGLWTHDPANGDRETATRETGADLVVTSLREAVERIVADARAAPIEEPATSLAVS